LIEGGVLTVERWPIEHEMRGRFDYHTDQDELLAMFTLRIQKHAVSVMATDFDEYLRIQNSTLYQRPCPNSLYCRSPIKDWLEENRTYSQVQFETVIVVPDAPPADVRLTEDAYRYESSPRLPLPVFRVWSREHWNNRLINHCKFFYQTKNMLGLLTHGGSGIRPSTRDFTKEVVFVYHYHSYPIWFERDQVTAKLDTACKQARVDKFWHEEAVRDTYVSDVFDQIKWPVGSDEKMLQAVRPYYMRKHTVSK
jgi:hypothetical protein